MFLEMLSKRNPALIQAAALLHQKGAAEPNSYVIDMDTLRQNAAAIMKSANTLGLSVFAMTKQMGRNPVVCEALKTSGIDRFVAVDPWEAVSLHKNGFHLGNVGHLVQIPKAMMGGILAMSPSYITVYTAENAAMVNEEAKKIGVKQKLLLRIENGGVVYPGQEGGIPLAGLEAAAKRILSFGNVEIGGITAFPCVLFDEEQKAYTLTSAAEDVKKARCILEGLGLKDIALNLPSANACGSMEMIKIMGGNIIEPGHAFTGTTPAHAFLELPEIPCVAYLTEVSHTDGKNAYVYGGGNYARGHIRQAMAGATTEALMESSYGFSFPPDSNIDYYGALSGGGNLPVGATAIAAFRTQIFVTRAKVIPVSGIHDGNIRIEGIFDALGNPAN